MTNDLAEEKRAGDGRDVPENDTEFTSQRGSGSSTVSELIDSSNEVTDAIEYLHGPRLICMSIALAAMLFMVSLETTITTTSIVAITDDLGGFQSASWILSAYQLGWVAFMVISSKLSDIISRKVVFIASIIFFAVFSGGCAAAQTMPQLIVLRALQGVGGGSCLALTTIMITEAVPPKDLSSYASRMNTAFIFALVLGPVIGGTISSNTTWRWVFIVNIPICAVLVVLAWFAIPANFPHLGHAVIVSPKAARWGRLDIVGSVLILLAALSFTACFQEAESRFAWDSAYVIVLLVMSVVLGCLLLFWERRISLAKGVCEPIIPWWFIYDRVRLGVIFGFILTGVPVVVTNFQLPQRFQLVNKLSSINAGLRIIPFGASSAVGSLFSSVLSNKLRVPAIYLLQFGAILQVTGFALLSVLPSKEDFQNSTYGYMVVAGLGTGMSYMTLYLLIPFTSHKKDRAIAMGVCDQFRTMGSAVGLAIVTSVFNGYLRPRLAALGISGGPGGLADITVSSSSPEGPLNSKPEIVTMLSDAYDRQMIVLCAFAAAQFCSAFLLWRKRQIVTS